MTVFILLGYQYFQQLRAWSPSTHRRFSLTGVFVLGLLITMSASYIYQASLTGPFAAALSVGIEGLGVAIICVMYFQQINETMQA